MKKLLLATGIFMSIGLAASAQANKAAIKTVAPAETAQPAPVKFRKRSKMTATNEQRVARKVAVENGKVAPARTSKAIDKSKETRETAN